MRQAGLRSHLEPKSQDREDLRCSPDEIARAFLAWLEMPQDLVSRILLLVSAEKCLTKLFLSIFSSLRVLKKLTNFPPPPRFH